MLYTEKIERIVEVAIASEHVLNEKNTRPLNLMLITLSGGGKSAILLEKFGMVTGVKAFGDITYQRLADKWLDKAYRGEIHTWAFPEFNKILGRKESTAKNTIGLVDEACEEGCPSIDLPYFSRTWNPPVRVNVLIGLTPSFFNAHLIDWWEFGFQQRFLPITWKYSKHQEKEVMKFIKKQYHLKQGVYHLKVEDREIELPEKFCDKIEEKFTMPTITDMTNYVERVHLRHKLHFNRELERELPFRTQMRLQKFLKALALLNGNSKVTVADYFEFRDLFRFMNMKFNEPL